MHDFFAPISIGELGTLFRLLVATVLGGVVGWERERSGKVAGLRTHSLVALGSALFTAVSVLLYKNFPSLGGVQGFDYHIVANIIVGIGFIGAGAILRTGERVSGTTTAASLWVVAAIGMASGLGFYREAVATTVLSYAVLAGLWVIEKRMRSSIHYRSLHPNSEAARREAEE